MLSVVLTTAILVISFGIAGFGRMSEALASFLEPVGNRGLLALKS